MLFRRVFQTQPHKEEITKVDDKHGVGNIFLKAEISNVFSSNEAFVQIPCFLFQRNWNCHIKEGSTHNFQI